jgi:hypothetical protein
MKPPPYISLIQGGWIRIEGSLKAIQGLSDLAQSKLFGFSGLKYQERQSPFDNDDLISKLLELNTLGVAFGEDYKQACDPAGMMAELQKRAILRSPFTSIYWTGPGQWHLRINEEAQQDAT